jgi:peptidoglycan/xylan/chitin deacetylase (PgdA/CDA1 family)
MIDLINILPSLTGQNLILPFYHAVSDNVPVHLKHLYKVRSTLTFEKDLDVLLKHYEPVSIEDIHEHITLNKSLPRNAFSLSFDDGLTEFKEVAWPILKRKGIPVALFVNSGFVDNKALFFRFKASILIDFIQNNSGKEIIKKANELFSSMVDLVSDLESFVRGIKYGQRSFLDDLALYFDINFEEYLKDAKPYLSSSDLMDLKAQGVHIGAHSVSHPLFNELSEADKLSEFTGSVNWVKDTFNQAVHTFSFPFTDYGISSEFFKTVNAPQNKLTNLTFGTAGLKKEKIKTHLQRIPIEDYKTDMQQILQHQYLYYLAKVPFFKNTIRR